ncbi:MAG: DUF554 domain-containing protein [Oscillospiraceae bacterium]|nr:DUF554 domain-containing protein [Oscillospiraceae bacterium]
MTGQGTIINTAAVLAGGAVGMLLKNGIPEKVQRGLMQACGVATIFIGAAGVLANMLTVEDGTLGTQGTMLLIFSLVLGTALGAALKLEEGLDRLGERLKAMVKRQNDSLFVDGFVNTSLIICAGAMGIVGAIQDGVSGDYSMLAAKAVLDFIIVMVLASIHGVGTLFSALPLLIYQGAITLVAFLCGPFIGETLILQLTLVGSALVFCVGINLCFGKKLAIGNMLPAILVPIVYAIVRHIFAL